MQTTQQLLVFIHHPVLPVNSTVDKKYPLQNRDEVAGVLMKPAVPVEIFCGHCHTESDTRSSNLHQVVTPAVSFQARSHTENVELDNSHFGYRIITVSETIRSSLVLFRNEPS